MNMLKPAMMSTRTRWAENATRIEDERGAGDRAQAVEPSGQLGGRQDEAVANAM